MEKIKVAIAGVGNCASSLIQGLEYCESLFGARPDKIPGLMHYDLGGYRLEDIEFVAAFDIDERKVGEPLRNAIFAKPNCTKKICDVFGYSHVIVQKGPVLDGASPHMKDYPEDKRFIVSRKKPCDVVKALKDSSTEILLCYLPVGSQKAVEFYAEACLQARASFINCVPVFIASDKEWEKKFRKKKIPIVGDDIKSQIGATIVHRTLTKLFEDRGMKIDRTYQLNVGGNTDFLNMLNRKRVKSKKISKTEAVQSQMHIPLGDENIYIGPSDYIPWLLDNKNCFLRMEGRGFGNIRVNLEMRLSVEDSPNSAGVVIDAIRCCRLARDREIGGSLVSASAYFMKHPPAQFSDDVACQMVEDFIKGKRDD